MKKKLLACVLVGALLSSVVAWSIAPVIILGEGIELILGAASSGVAGSAVATLASTTSAGVSALWSGVIASLGAAVIYAGIKENSGNQVRFPVHSANGAPPQPSGAPSTSSARSYGCAGYASCEAFCAASGIEGYYGATFSRLYYDTQNHYAMCYWHTPNDGGTDSPWVAGAIAYMPYTGSGCVSGYSASGADCVLSNARAVVADTKCDIMRTGTVFQYATGDLDCAVSGPVKGSIAGDTWSVGGVDQYGNPVQISVKAESGGGTSISQSVGTKNAAGNDIITEKSVRFASDGTPLGNTQTQRPGTMVPSDSSQTVNINNAPAGSVTNITTSSGGSSSITFPNDYNRESTQQDIKTDIHSMVTSSSVSDPTPATSSDVSPLLFVSTFTSLLAWSLPSHTSICPAPVVTAFETAFTVDTHCTIAASLGTEISTSFALVWLLLALFIVLSA